MLFYSCSDRLVSPDGDESAYQLEVGKGWVLSEKSGNKITVKSTLFGDRNVYHENNIEKTFLFA